MLNPPLHAWNLDPEQAAQLQQQLRSHLKLTWDERPVRFVGGSDVSFSGSLAHAVIVVMSFPQLEVVDYSRADSPVTYPYIPGLLAFREGPAVIAAWERLTIKPDLLLMDGQGIAHPRAFGLAAHLGLWLNIPTIGIAKTRLFGHHEPVGDLSGDWSALYDEQNPSLVIGAALRTRANVKPVYVSPGHLIDLDHAITFTLACCRGFRLPEPCRLAHKLCKEAGKMSDLEILARLR